MHDAVYREIDVGPVVKPPQAKSQAAPRRIFAQSDCTQHMAWSRLSRCAGGPAADSQVAHRQKQRFAVDVAERHVEVPRQPQRRAIIVAGGERRTAEQYILQMIKECFRELVSQRGQPNHFFRYFFRAKPKCFGKPDDAGYIQRAAAASLLLPAAKYLRLYADDRIASPHVKGADTFWPVDLVRG